MNFIAHRGFSKRFPENSLPAFQAVVDHPFNGRSLIGIELDIHLTADERIPVIHETTVMGDNGKRIPVAQCTFERLNRLLLRKHGATAPAVPAIEDVLELIRHRTELCFEIKSGPYDLNRFFNRFAGALAVYHPTGDVVVSSFSFEVLEEARRHLTRFDVRYAFIFDSFRELDRIPADQRQRFDLYHPHYKLVLNSPERFVSGGPSLRCWTINSPRTVRRLIACTPATHVDAIMTDNIDLAEAYASECNC